VKGNLEYSWIGWERDLPQRAEEDLTGKKQIEPRRKKNEMY